MFWFLVAVVFLILWLRERSKGNKDQYSLGYKDGFSAAKQANDLAEGTIAAADGASVSQETPQSTMAATTNDKFDDLGFEQQIDTAPNPLPSPKETAEEKERATLRNLNTLLYMASFLLVAAAATFIAAAMPETVRLIVLIIVVTLFYASGVILYKKSDKLKPAATAFIGTGLAILPFIGIALSLLGGIPEAQSWLVISIIGLAAYLYATVLLQSQVVAYLSMAFVLSLASSAIATASLPLIWYFIVLIGISLASASIAFLKPSLVPEIFKKPIDATGQLVTPVTVVASLLLADRITIDMYQIVFGLGTAHYLVVWLQQRQYIYEMIIRALGHITLLVVAWDIATTANTPQPTLFGLCWLLLAVVQAIYSLIRVQTTTSTSRQGEATWIATSMVAVLLGTTLWATNMHVAALTTTSFAIVGLISAGALIVYRHVAWAYVGLFISIVVPLMVGRWILAPAVSWEIMLGGFVALAIAGLGLYQYSLTAKRSSAVQILFASTFIVYMSFAIVCGLFAQNAITLGWAFAIICGLLVLFSYASRAVVAEVIGVVTGICAVALWLSASSLDPRWIVTATVTISAGLVGAGAIVHHLIGRENSGVDRRNSLIAITLVVFAGITLNSMSSYDEVLRTSVILLSCGVVTGFAMRRIVAAKSAILRQLFTASYFIYLTFAWIVALTMDPGWIVLVYALASLVFWLSSHTEKIPVLAIAGNIAFVATLYNAWIWLAFPTYWMTFSIVWVAAAVFYALYWLYVDHRDEQRQLFHLGSVWLVLATGILIHLYADTSQQIAGAATLLAIAATIAVHGYLRKSDTFIEVGVYVAVFGMQRIVAIILPEVNMVFYAHWWALVVALVALWRKRDVMNRLVVAMAMITCSTGIMALANGGGYQLLFLAEHLGLLAAGALLRKQWAIWWGVIASAAAVLYFIKDYVYLWLGLLGLSLIALVVWRLIVMGNKGKGDQ